MNIKDEIVFAVVNYRKKNDLTQEELAKKIGIHQQALSKFESQKVEPRIDTVIKILDYIGYELTLKEKK